MSRIWKDIEGFEGRYQVSDDGNVRSLPDIDDDGKYRTGTVLVPVTGGTGYAVATFYEKCWLVHRLVASAFIPNPEGLPEVNHLDGDKLNANFTNLEWCTRAQNQQHRFRVLGHKSGTAGKRGIECANSKPVEARSTKTGTHHGVYGSASEAARSLGISSSGVTLAASGKVRAHKGFTWRYITRDEYLAAANA